MSSLPDPSTMGLEPPSYLLRTTKASGIIHHFFFQFYGPRCECYCLMVILDGSIGCLCELWDH